MPVPLKELVEDRFSFHFLSFLYFELLEMKQNIEAAAEDEKQKNPYL
ncbi:hypothetical protein QNN00_09335 [Bacillus velezensis]|nr:hypothetical protein [Bacillus velezensis]